MAVYNYSKYKIRIDSDSQKTQGLQVGDIVRRQYAERNQSIYSLMVVVETGVDAIDGKESPYFIGALLDGDEPKSGELLDFVRTTSLTNTDRSGAMYLTASDSDAPYMDIIDGMATERSLCYPTMTGGTVDIPDKAKYAVYGDVATEYRSEDSEANRIVRITGSGSYGIKQTLEESVAHPERLLVSFKARASQNAEAAISFGYTNGEKLDAEDTISLSTEWEYKLWVLTVEYPKQYSRSLTIDLTNAGEWCEVADLNIIRLSSVAVFTDATKARVGKVSGVIDPVLGVLEGYGAYFQNLYATRNVNIAGTLTAGDENGFGATFYVGKIHKNVLLDSLSCDFAGANEVVASSPVGIGKCVRLTTDSYILAQNADWRNERLGSYYCFSVWLYAEELGTVRFYQDEHLIGDIVIDQAERWIRHKAVFPIRQSDQGGSWSDSEIYMRGFDNTNIAVMINGIPVNDLETRSVYWSNWASISDVAAVVQTQRGLGASKVSNPSVGGTINIVTKSSSKKKSGTFVYGVGADGYNKAQLSLNSGLLKNGWSFSLSGGRTWGNGYARGTSFDAYNYFVNVSKLFKGGHELKLTAFGSPQHHYMRSNALTMDEWKKVKNYNTSNKHWDRFNPDYGTDKYGNRKSADYNVYHAPFVILNHSWQINEKSNLSTSIYATFGSGYGHSGMANSDTYSSMDWYGAVDGVLNNTFRGEDGSVDYGKIQDINIASQTGSQLILAKQKNVNTSTGAIVCYTNEFAEKWRFNVGLDARYFKARHTYEILDLFAGGYYVDPARANVAIENNSAANADGWSAEKLGVGDIIQRDYDAVIVQEGVFSQLEYSAQQISAFISGGLNYSHYWRYDRFYYDANHAKSQVVNYLGGNIKAGANYNINNKHNIFANLGYISNVPKFKNGAFMSANTSHAVNPDAKNEQILSAEIGYGFHNSWLDLKFNGYITNWKDKAMFKKGSLPNKEQYVINMTGVDALHMGLELEAFIRPTHWLNIAAMVSIGDWRWSSKSAKGYAYDLYGNAITTEGEITSVGASDHAWASINMANVPVGGSAQTTAALEMTFKPYKDLYLSIGGTVYDRNYSYYSFSGSNLSLGKELVINTPWVIPTYATMDIRAGYTFDVKGFPLTLSGGVNNLLDNHYIEKAWDPSNISKSESLPDPSKVYLFYSIGRTWNISLKLQF